jgi:hypothetical protein
MEPAQFAQLLGIHTSTLYRWESVGPAPVRVEPLQRQLLTVLDDQLAERNSLRARAELSETILKGLLIGGGLLGLFYLLSAAFGDGGKVRRAPDSRSDPSSAPDAASEGEKGVPSSGQG